MRDLERWKDKVELSLDGRQIFFLFFGTAVAICLVFVVGVLTGKRIEAHALALTPAPVDDPLAALDQLGDEDFTYAKTLTAHVSTAKGAKEAEPAGAARASSPKSEPAHALPVLSKTEPAMSLPKLPPSSMENGELTTAAKAESQATEGREKSARPPVAARTALPLVRPQLAATEHHPNHFTLQLSAFPDRGDADAFMHKIQAAGYHPFMVASEIPGKGLFYRVRVGDYGSRQAALAAKAAFEHKQRMIAYVARL